MPQLIFVYLLVYNIFMSLFTILNILKKSHKWFANKHVVFFPEGN